MTKPSQIIYSGALALIAVITAILLVPEPVSSGSALEWSRVPLPLVFAAGAGHHAYKAYRRSEHSTTDALLLWGTLAVTIMMLLSA